MTVGAVGLDGHDGAGKTTLAVELARRLGGAHARPFSGPLGPELLAAGEAGDSARVLKLGRIGIEGALADAAGGPVVLDRSWMTVATLVPWPYFEEHWRLWVPTVLVLADRATTLARLSTRAEPPQAAEWHDRYLDAYATIAATRDVPIVRTDAGASVSGTVDALVAVVERLGLPVDG